MLSLVTGIAFALLFFLVVRTGGSIGLLLDVEF